MLRSACSRLIGECASVLRVQSQCTVASIAIPASSSHLCQFRGYLKNAFSTASSSSGGSTEANKAASDTKQDSDEDTSSGEPDTQVSSRSNYLLKNHQVIYSRIVSVRDSASLYPHVASCERVGSRAGRVASRVARFRSVFISTI